MRETTRWISTMVAAYSEFSYSELPAATSRLFYFTKIIDSNVHKLGYYEHTPVVSVFFCIFLLVVRQCSLNAALLVTWVLVCTCSSSKGFLRIFEILYQAKKNLLSDIKLLTEIVILLANFCYKPK